MRSFAGTYIGTIEDRNYKTFFETDNFHRDPFVLPSVWELEWGALSESLKELIKKDIRLFHSLRPQVGREGSLMVEEERALRELKVNQNIVIKPADKGSKIVIMDKQQYRLEAQRQLGNEKYYKCISNSIHPEVQQQIRRIVHSLHHKSYFHKTA